MHEQTSSAGPQRAYEAIVGRGGAPEHAARVATMRRDFERRTGSFGPEDPWFDARSRAFWDEATTTLGFARLVEPDLEPSLRSMVGPLERAHRGLFRGTMIDDALVLVDAWSGAEFVVHGAEAGVADALEAASGYIDGRLVGLTRPLSVYLLPGAVFHPEAANEPVGPVLQAARAKGMTRHEALDALLRMERSLRSLARVKASYAYRVEALALC